MKEMASRAGVSLTTSEIAAPPARFGEVAAANARYYDLSLIGWEAGNQAGRMTAEGVVFASGRPVMLLPDTTQIDVIDHVVVAWDGSRAAARAVADAQPFLERASEITVVTVLGDKSIREKDAERLTRELQKRGYPATGDAIRAEDCAISVTLQEHALEIGGQLLVMGGYGHSRIRDFVLGGATKGMLDDLRLPVLLSH
jgi:nucleotide-binding universal stress UspA family protein